MKFKTGDIIYFQLQPSKTFFIAIAITYYDHTENIYKTFRFYSNNQYIDLGIKITALTLPEATKL